MYLQYQPRTWNNTRYIIPHIYTYIICNTRRSTLGATACTKYMWNLIYIMLFTHEKLSIVSCCLLIRMYCVLPKTTPEGDRVTILKFFDTDPAKYDPVTVFKIAIMLTDANFTEDRCRRHVLVYDMNGATMAHAAALTIPTLKKFLTSGSVRSFVCVCLCVYFFEPLYFSRTMK